MIGGLLLAQGDKNDDAVPASPSAPAVADETERPVELPAGTSDPIAEATATLREPAADATPVTSSRPVPTVESATAAAAEANWRRVIASLTVFVLAVFVGFEVITKVPPTLHTPLMSGSNAISGITLVGAVIVASSISFPGFVGLIAVALATVNAVGGFMVTHRMLAMFKKR
jgi:NAD(P) transhydrogenase subunit alpha